MSVTAIKNLSYSFNQRAKHRRVGKQSEVRGDLITDNPNVLGGNSPIQEVGQI